MRADRTLAALTAAVGTPHLLTAPDDLARYVIDERRLYHGRPLAVVRPATTAEVAAVVTVCAEHGIGMVPQGGNTGYCGGATPDTSGRELVISLERLNRVRAIDAAGCTLTVEAGVILADAQAAAARAGLLLPLSMGSQGSCQIGGNLSTNAGGLAVLKYGTARDLALGLEVVLPDGRVLDALRALRKDNTGYDLKQLFIGAEGTLGIITAAVLKLSAQGQRVTAWLAVRDSSAACALLALLRKATVDGVTSFEYMTADALARLGEALPALRLPLAAPSAHQVLVECQVDDERVLESALEQAMTSGLVVDAVLARSTAQARALWQLRESIPAAEKLLGGSVKHDVSLVIGDVPAYIEQAVAAVRAHWPSARLSVYGHIGDGNVHFNVLAPAGVDGTAFRATHAVAISEVVHDLAASMGGSFSAEHGVGQFKRELLARYTDPAALSLMHSLKATLDPRGLMNPGKLFAAAPAQAASTP